MNFRKVHIKNNKCFYFDDINKSQDFDFDNILIDEKSHKIFWFITFYIKICLLQNNCV